MPEQFKVNATSLNLRSSPVVDSSNILTTLPHGHTVIRLEISSDGWWEVSAVLNGQSFQGFVASKFLISLDVSLAGIVANNKILTFDELKQNKLLVIELQKKLRNLGLYPGGQWIDGLLGSQTSRTWQGLNTFCTFFALSLPSTDNAMNSTLAQALLDKKQILSILEQAKNAGSILTSLAKIQSDTPVTGGHLAFLDRTIKNSPLELEVKNYPTYLSRHPDGISLISYGKTFQLSGSGKIVTFDDYPSLGNRPNIDSTGLDFLDDSIDHACVCVGSFIQGSDEIKTHWLGRQSLVEAQFLSSTKFIGVLNTICQLNKTHPNSDVDNCVIGYGSANKRYSFPALVEDILTYGEKIAPSNSIAAMFKRFSSRQGLEDWTIAITGNQGLSFRGYYGFPPFIDSPILFDTTLTGNQVVLKAASEVGGGPNSISAYDLVRLISMLGWHMHLPHGLRLPDAQWSSLESVVRAMGVDTARYIDIALETLGLVNIISEPVVISKLGLGPSALTYVALLRLVDTRQVPAKLKTLAMSLWTSGGSDVNRDNNMAAAVTEIMRRVFTEELA
jgi:Bacterial SH3 domain